MCRLCPTLLCTLLEIEIRSQPAASLAARGFVAREACVAAQRTPRLLCRRGTEVSCVAALFSSLARRHLASLLVPRSPPPRLSSRPSLAATSPVFSSLARRHLTCVLVPRSPPPHLSSRPSIAATSPVFSPLAAASPLFSPLAAASPVAASSHRRRFARLLPQAWPAAADTPCEEGCLPLHSACAAAPPEVIAEVAAASRYRPAICCAYTVNIRTWPPPAGAAPRSAAHTQLIFGP